MPLLAAQPVTVLPDQREVLEQLVRTHSTPQQLAMRARLILHAADAMGVHASARELGVRGLVPSISQRSVGRFLKKRPTSSRIASGTG